MEARRIGRCPMQRPTARLIVGVLGFEFAGSAHRQAQIRSLISARAGDVDVVFVLGAGGRNSTHADPADDVLRLRVPPKHREASGKFFLQNEFLRYAISCERPLFYRFIARMDEDAIVNASSIATLLESYGQEQHLVAGNFKTWYSWDAENMHPYCWSYTPTLVMSVRRQFAIDHGVRPSTAMSAREAKRRPLEPRELADVLQLSRSLARRNASFARHNRCVWTSGPFPFAKGPFVAFSHALVRRVMHLPELLTDEDRVRRFYWEGGFNVSKARSGVPWLLLEDVYFGYLISKHLARAQLMMVRLSMAEWGTGWGPPAGPGRAHIYHKLKQANRFTVMANRTRDYLGRPVRARLNCDGGSFGKQMLVYAGCCELWRQCKEVA